MHDYPSMLPDWLSKGYEYSQMNTISRTKFLSGRSRTRNRAITAPETYTLNTVMTADQLAIFEAWLMHTVKYVEPMNIRIATATDCDIKTVKLTDNGFAKKMMNPFRYRVSIVVEAETQSVMSAADLAAALAAG